MLIAGVLYQSLKHQFIARAQEKKTTTTTTDPIQIKHIFCGIFIDEFNKKNKVAYFGNFCTGLMSKLSSVNLPLCSRAIFSRKRANAGLWLDVVRIADFARLTLFTNNVSINITIYTMNRKIC